MLAERASRSMHGGGGAIERNVAVVAVSWHVGDNRYVVIIRSWSMIRQMLRIVM